MDEIEMPLDADSYLDRECPTCLRHFRWHHGPVEGAPRDAPEPVSYFCPYCGADAPLDQWWTTEQVEAIQQAASGVALREVRRAFRKGLGNSKGFTFKPSSTSIPPPSPIQIDETDQLIAIASPCHPYEPVKILRSWSDPCHCLVCGARFVL